MKRHAGFLLFAVSSAVVLLNLGGCLLQWMGMTFSDAMIYRNLR
jgi:hypothetical protein